MPEEDVRSREKSLLEWKTGIAPKDILMKGTDRKSDLFAEVSWGKALDYAAKRLREIKETNGPDSIGGLSSARCTNEENYLFQKFIRAIIGTNNIDHCARL